MKLNIGCGKRRIEGFTGVDAVQRPGVDIVAPAGAIPLPTGCADEIMAIHLFEHIKRWDVESTLAEWYRLLKPGGLLVLELPNLVKCCQNYLAGISGKHPDQMGRFGIYGDATLKDEFMLHAWGYSPFEMITILNTSGFTCVGERPTQFHPVGRDQRDMRIEATRV